MTFVRGPAPFLRHASYFSCNYTCKVALKEIGWSALSLALSSPLCIFPSHSALLLLLLLLLLLEILFSSHTAAVNGDPATTRSPTRNYARSS